MSDAKRRQRGNGRRGGARERRGRAIVQQRAQSGQPDHVEGAQRDCMVGSPCNRAGIRERFAAPPLERDRDGVGAIGRLEDGVHHEALVLEAERRELAARARRLAERGGSGRATSTMVVRFASPRAVTVAA